MLCGLFHSVCGLTDALERLLLLGSGFTGWETQQWMLNRVNVAGGGGGHTQAVQGCPGEGESCVR